MTRDKLNQIRHAILDRFEHAWDAAESGAPADLSEGKLVALNALHELLCRELDRPDCQHKLDDLMCGVEVIRGHLRRAMSETRVNHESCKAALDTCNAILASPDTVQAQPAV